MSAALLDEIVAMLEGAQQVLIFSHLRPDGDAVGSALGLAWLLRGQGKMVTVSFADPTPAALRFLPGVEDIADVGWDGHDLVVAVDGSDAARYGAHFLSARGAGVPVLVIDHHKTNTQFGTLNWMDATCAATAQMLVQLAHHARWPLSPEAATCLATGCVTDTNLFSTDHTTPEVLETVAELMRGGAPLADIVRQAMNLRTRADAALWGRILATVEQAGGVAWALNRRADRLATGATEGDGSGVVTFLRDIEGINIAILFVEADDGTTRLSLRSRPGYDVGALAFELGGGGHTQAAGVTLALPLTKAVALVVARAGGGPAEGDRGGTDK